jgi:hypothetical protein
MTGWGRSVFDHRLQFAFVLLGYFAAENQGDFLGLPQGAIEVQQALSNLVNGGATMEDEVVTILHLREEEPVLTARRLALLGGEERSEGRQPFLSTTPQILGGKRVGQLLHPTGMAAPQGGVGALLKVDFLFSQAKRQPMVLVQAYPRREGEVGTQADKHPAQCLSFR